ncbi:unnamed protein product [Urochloa humidicola]
MRSKIAAAWVFKFFYLSICKSIGWSGAKSASRKVLEGQEYLIARHPEFCYRTEFQSHEPELEGIG